MITPSPRFRYYLAFTLLAVLAVLLRLSAQAGPPPGGTIQQRALAYSRYLTQALQLYPHQAQLLRRCTEQQLTSLDSLAVQPTAQPAAYAAVEAHYLADVQPTLTPGQYAALVLLRKQKPAEPTPQGAVSTR